MLVEQKDAALRAGSEPKVGAAGRRPALPGVLLANQLQERLRSISVVEQDAADGVLTAGRQLVGMDVEDLAAREVPEEHQVRELRDRAGAVDVHPGDRRVPLQQRIELAIFRDRIAD